MTTPSRSAFLIALLVELGKPIGILERNDPKVRALEGLASVKGTLYGEVPPAVRVRENQIQYQADLWEGQKTGLFLDQRENRCYRTPDPRECRRPPGKSSRRRGNDPFLRRR